MPKMSVRPADTMNSRSPCTTPFSTETTRNSTPDAPSPEPASGARALHLARGLHRARRVLARHQADRLEAHVGAVHLVLGLLRYGRDHQGQQRLVIFLAHGDLPHARVEADRLHRERGLLDVELAVRAGLDLLQRLAEPPDAVHGVALDEHGILPHLGLEIVGELR